MNEIASTSVLNRFSDRLMATANELSAMDNRELTTELKPALAGQNFSGGTTPASILSPSDLPAESVVLRISRYTLILGMLPDSPALEAVQDAVRRYRNQCVIARSFLEPMHSLDMLLFLVGPRGSDIDSAWDALAKFVERDDRVARKLVWLMPEDSRNDDESYKQFIKRTFFARPWIRPGDFDDVELDRLSNPEVNGDGLPAATIAAWEDAVLDKEMAPDEIVEELVKAWKTGRIV